ncbi:hypothetical protein GCM10009119_16520 [Algoriphagus jejuensis]|uniref:Protein kinase domain-containing protein n=1 Tax=Algoriphagus jejuensis TaxID=419934 RepID=A0ABN1MZV8_9BACT
MRLGEARWKQLEQLFHELTQLSKPEKAERMELMSRDDPEIVGHLQSLLAADEESHPIFQREPGDVLQILENDHQLLGSRIGAFQLLELIGQGAMGTVFRAQRIDGQFDQAVAIKLMRPLLIHPASRSFFERERQILAKLNHPFIARLYDGGFTEDGRPFFTMEWVSGQNLLDHCRDKGLGLFARLRLFGEVAQAVRYAHQSLIAHLDLKPQNIIVNDVGQVKLLDFGVSQMLDERPQQEGSFTLAYAAPEQILRNQPNTAADIYALGVILFQLLSNHHPFQPHLEDPGRLKNAVLEGGTLPFRLSPDFEKVPFAADLELISKKAMEPDPMDRYASVDELIRDLNDFRNDYPVAAHPKSWAYRSQKYVRRNRNVVAVVSSAILLFFAMGVFYTSQLREQRNIAQAEAKRANQITVLITDVFSAADPNIGGADTLTAVQLLNQGVENLSKNLGDDPALYADMLSRISPIYLSLGQYEKGMELAQESYRINLKLPSASVETLSANEVNLSSSYFMFGDLDSAVFFSQKAVNRLKNMGEDVRASLVDALLEYGSCLYDRGDFDRADSALSAGLILARKEYEPPHLQLASLLHMKGATARKMEDWEDAERFLLEALAMKKQLFQEPHLEIAYSYNYFASLYQSLGDYEKALGYVQESLEQRRAILGKYHVEVVASMGNLGRTYIGLGRPLEAVPLYEEGIAIIDSILGKEHYYYGALHGSVGNAYFDAGEFEKARSAYLVSLESFDRLLPAEDPRRVSPREKLGLLAQKEGHFELAKRYLEEALEIREAQLPAGHQDIAQSQQALGECLLAMGDYPTAIELLKKARSTSESEPMQNPEMLAQVNQSLALAYEKLDELKGVSGVGATSAPKD